MPNNRKDAQTVYRSYSFIDKDPIIYRIATMMKDAGVKSYAKLGADSDVSPSTYSGWFHGTVKRPKFCTIVATVRALGYDIEITQHRRTYTEPNIRVPPKLRSVQVSDLRAVASR